MVDILDKREASIGRRLVKVEHHRHCILHPLVLCFFGMCLSYLNGTYYSFCWWHRWFYFALIATTLTIPTIKTIGAISPKDYHETRRHFVPSCHTQLAAKQYLKCTDKHKCTSLVVFQRGHVAAKNFDSLVILVFVLCCIASNWSDSTDIRRGTPRSFGDKLLF